VAEELVVSKPGEIRRNVTVVALPVQQDGATIVLKIGAVPTLQVIEALDGIPGANVGPESDQEKKSFAEMRETFVKSVRPTALLASRGILEPEFSFDGREDGKAFWDDLVTENQAFVVSEILKLSGWKGGEKPETAGFPEGAAR
jgi:hypothetical protein